MVRHRGDGRWEGRIELDCGPGGRRRQKYVRGRTKREVTDQLHRVRTALDQGRPVFDERMRVDDFLARWLDEVVKPRRSHGHWRNCESHVRLHIAPAIGRVRLARLTAVDVEALINATRAKGVSDDTVRLVHATLRAALGVAKRWALVHDNVATLVEPVTVHRQEVSPFTEEEAGRLLGAAREDPLGAFVTVALALGLRPGEARALKWEDVEIDGPAPSLRVRRAFHRGPGCDELGTPKTPRSLRTLALPPQCAADLRSRRLVQREDRLRAGSAWEEMGFIFTGLTGRPVSHSAIARWFAALAARAGVTGHRLYDCRHTAASLLLAQGVQPRVVMEILGHSTYRLTMDTYAHVMPAAMSEAADATEQVLLRLASRGTSGPSLAS